MKQLKFTVSLQKDCSISELLKEINNIKCKIFMDMKNGYVVVENVDNAQLDMVIELVDNYYEVLEVYIDNTITPSETSQSNAESKNTGTSILPSISVDDVSSEKIEFNNESITEALNKLLKTIYWAMFHKNVSAKEILNFIYTWISELSMAYNNKGTIPFSLGDVVDCNYGHHLYGESNGNHVSAIVCNVLNDMAYVVPIHKIDAVKPNCAHLKFTVPKDITYNKGNLPNGVVILAKGRYVRLERLNSVIGKTSPQFFKNLLKQLPFAFDFTN